MKPKKEESKKCKHKWKGNGTYATGSALSPDYVYSAIFCEICGKIKIETE